MAQKLMREMFRLSFGEEVGNAVSHGVMAVITFILLPLFAVYSYIQGGVIRAAGTSIYLMCMFFMFLTSTIYHSMSYGSPQKYVFRKLDHIAILFAIAGSYTPVCLSLIQGTSGIVILIIEWSMVLGGRTAQGHRQAQLSHPFDGDLYGDGLVRRLLPSDAAAARPAAVPRLHRPRRAHVHGRRILLCPAKARLFPFHLASVHQPRQHLSFHRLDLLHLNMQKERDSRSCSCFAPFHSRG